MNDTDERWLQQVRTQLDHDARDLDASTASRLNRARQAALDAGLRPRRSPLRSWYGLATALALLLTFAVMLRTPEPPAPAAPVAAADADDFEMLAGAEDLELIENLEFYAWLEQQSLDG